MVDISSCCPTSASQACPHIQLYPLLWRFAFLYPNILEKVEQGDSPLYCRKINTDVSPHALNKICCNETGQRHMRGGTCPSPPPPQPTDLIHTCQESLKRKKKKKEKNQILDISHFSKTNTNICGGEGGRGSMHKEESTRKEILAASSKVPKSTCFRVIGY